jgi:hypothetical protein
MNSAPSFPVLSNPPSELPLLYVEERDGRISAFVFRGEVKHVDRVLKMWANGKFTSDHTEDASIGGGALRSFASLRLKMMQERLTLEEGDPSCLTVRVRVVKNKLAPPEREALLYYSLASGTLAEEPPTMVAERSEKEP